MQHTNESSRYVDTRRKKHLFSITNSHKQTHTNEHINDVGDITSILRFYVFVFVSVLFDFGKNPDESSSQSSSVFMLCIQKTKTTTKTIWIK